LLAESVQKVSGRTELHKFIWIIQGDLLHLIHRFNPLLPVRTIAALQKRRNLIEVSRELRNLRRLSFTGGSLDFIYFNGLSPLLSQSETLRLQSLNQIFFSKGRRFGHKFTNGFEVYRVDFASEGPVPIPQLFHELDNPIFGPRSNFNLAVGQIESQGFCKFGVIFFSDLIVVFHREEGGHDCLFDRSALALPVG
jgi:hypothetical protein